MASLLTLFRHASRAGNPATDRELLDGFAAGRDEDAFVELVRRHGPVVYRVCRRLVGGSSADDAFQAVFLVLATRLDAARAAGSVGGWLVGVAGRVGRQMRRAASRRARHEAAAADRAQRNDSREDPIDLADQFRVLDEELARLPDRLRDPVVLCLLQSRTQDEAAAELGRDVRTLRRRLERAKEVLRSRLERRGVVPAVAAALVTGAGSVSASVPAPLAARTTTTVLDFLTGGAGASQLPAVVLAKGVATTMIARKLMHFMAAAAVGLVGLGVVLAEGSEPIPAPRPAAVLPAASAPPAADSCPNDFDWKRDEERRRAALAAAGAAAKIAVGGFPVAVDRPILIDALCLKVPAGFCERIGLAEESSTAHVWVLSRREARMLTALFDKEPAKEVVSRPQLVTNDRRTGFIQVGQKIKLNSKVETLDVGEALSFTPQVRPDGNLMLEIETRSSAVSSAPVKLGNGATVPAINTWTMKVAITISDGESAVIRAFTSRENGKATETLWVLTVNRVNGQPKPAAPAASALIPKSAPALTSVPAGATPLEPQPPLQPAPTKMPPQPRP